MSTTFWAVFYGSALGSITVYLVQELVKEYKDRKKFERVQYILDTLEDSEEYCDCED